MDFTTIIPVPLWLVLVSAFFGALAYLILIHGTKPLAPKDRHPLQTLKAAFKANYVGFIILVALVVFGFAFRFYLFDVIVAVRSMVGLLRDAADIGADTGVESQDATLRNLSHASALLLGSLVAVATLVFTLIRMWINERTTTATEEGLITDRINAAVASLGAEKTVKDFETEKEYTRPNIEVRVGAILALERIARMNDSVHVQIMEILCTYIRANAPVRANERDMMAIFEKNYKIPSSMWKVRPDLHVFQSNQADHKLPEAPKPPREDIQLALTVIGRRSDRQIALEPAQLIDLRNTHLVKADLRNARLSNAQLSNSNMQGAILTDAKMNEAILTDAKMNGAVLAKAEMNGADLSNAKMNSANLSGAKMNSPANLRNAELNEAVLRNAEMIGAILTNAEMIGADLRDARMTGAHINNAKMKGADLANTRLHEVMLPSNVLCAARNVRMASLRGASLKNYGPIDLILTSNQLQGIFADASGSLYKISNRPAFWPTVKLEHLDFRKEWKKWQKSPKTYRFDPTLYGDKYTEDVGD